MKGLVRPLTLDGNGAKLGKPPAGVKPGDAIYFENTEFYLRVGSKLAEARQSVGNHEKVELDWPGENVITIVPNQFFGWGRAQPKTYAGWIDTLRVEYNNLRFELWGLDHAAAEQFPIISPEDMFRDIPGYENIHNAVFFDVAPLATRIFDLRKTEAARNPNPPA